MSELSVELGDLRGWAEQVGRASTDMAASKDYAATHIADADFGRILELISGDYADLIPKFHAVLQADGTRLGGTRDGLNTAAAGYRTADEQASGELAEVGGEQGRIEDDGVANGFSDPASPMAELVTPGGDGAALPELPEVSFGFLFDKVCDLVVMVGGPDPREEVTRWLAGDLEKAARHVSAWRAVSDAVAAVEDNLTAGKQAITNTWTGSAASAADTHMGRWTSCLTEQSTAMRAMGDHLNDIIGMAVDMAQVVVDIIKTLVSLVSAALANAAIPFYGQWKLIETVREGITMVWNAIRVVNVFINAVTLLINTIKMCVDYFGVDRLPPAPAAVPA